MASQNPYTGTPGVAPNLTPTPTEHIETPIAAFGGATAEAEKGLGRSVGEVGNELFSRAIAMQQLNEQAKAANAVADYTDKLGDLDVKYRSLEGKSAVDAYPQYKDDLNRIRDEVGKGLDSPYAQRTYLQESRSIQARAVIGAGIHAGEQQKKYLIGTEQASIDSATRLSATSPESEDAYKASLDKIESSGKMLGTIHGWNDSQTTDYISNAKSSLVFQRATNLARTNPTAAKSFLDDAAKSGIVNGEDAGKAGDYIRNHALNVTTRVETASALNGEGYHFGEGKVSTDKLVQAIKLGEGSGNYDPPHPDVTHKVNGVTITEHALGAYGVMQSNLQSWLKEAGMPAMSESAFIADHGAQDKLAAFKLGQYQEETGSANKAALKWFTGDPNADLSRSDGGSTAAQYLQRFNKNLARSATTADIDAASSRVADKVMPGDSEYAQRQRDHMLAENTRSQQIERQENLTRYNNISQAITTPGEDGRLPTSIDQIQDPAIHDAWNQLPQVQRVKIQDALVSNAKNEFADTPQTREEYNRWVGKIKTVGSPEEMKRVQEADFAGMHLPTSQRLELLKEQQKLFKATQADPNVTHAMGVLQRSFGDTFPNKKSNPDDYNSLAGAMDQIIRDRIQSTGKKPDEEEIETIGARLMRERVIGKSWFGFVDQRGEAYRTEVPEGEKAKIVNQYTKEKGVAPPEQLIHSIYIASQYNQLFGKSKAQP